MSKQHTETSKFLSFVLRHEPQAIGLKLDREGWAEINALIDGAKPKGGNIAFLFAGTNAMLNIPPEFSSFFGW